MNTTCPSCNIGTLTSTQRDHKFTLLGTTYIAPMPMRLCNHCEKPVISATDLMAFNRAVARHVAQNGPVTKETFRFLRTALNYQSAYLAGLLSVTPETISRWENGQREVDRWAWFTLGALVIDDVEGRSATLDRLASLHAARVVKNVRLDLAPRSRRVATRAAG